MKIQLENATSTNQKMHSEMKNLKE